MIRVFLVVAFATIGILACKTKKNAGTTTDSTTVAKTGQKPAFNVDLLVNTWKHSREEDTQGGRTYRPETYNFPPSRGPRTTYTFDKKGGMVKAYAGPTDGYVEEKGTYTIEGDKIIANLTNEKGKYTTSFQVISLADGVLRMKDLYGQ
jgi:hypothetical protein